MEEKGWTITYFPWETGKETVIDRFKTTEEKDNFLNEIHKPNSGWLEEELMSVGIINDFSYRLRV